MSGKNRDLEPVGDGGDLDAWIDEVFALLRPRLLAWAEDLAARKLVAPAPEDLAVRLSTAWLAVSFRQRPQARRATEEPQS